MTYLSYEEPQARQSGRLGMMQAPNGDEGNTSQKRTVTFRAIDNILCEV